MSTVTKTERLTYTVEEAATLLGIGRGLAYEAVRRGEIPTVRIGRRMLVPRAALERLLISPESVAAPEINGLHRSSGPLGQ